MIILFKNKKKENNTKEPQNDENLTYSMPIIRSKSSSFSISTPQNANKLSPSSPLSSSPSNSIINPTKS